VGFIKEMEEILYMMMMFQKIIYRGQDLAEKVRKWQLRFLKKAYAEV
jgi:hypothetical protein